MKKKNAKFQSAKKIINQNDFQIEIKESTNSEIFSMAKIWIMHDKQNPNMSYFDKWSIQDAVQRISNIPIVGYFMEEEENFGGHETELAIENNELVVKTKTVPIGVVPESADLAWEKVVDKQGIEREYLTVSNVVIWNRDKKIVDTLKTDDFGQSMEIDVINGYMDNGIEYIEKFDFKALCILGINKNGAGYVQPAFDDAKIQMYSKENKTLNTEISDMFKDLKFALNDIKNKEDNKLKLEELLKQFSLTEAELEAKIANYSELSVEDIQTQLEEFAKADAKAKEEADAKAKKDAEDKAKKSKEPKGDGEVAKLQAQIEKLQAENEKLKARIKELEGSNKKFEAEKHLAECKAQAETFMAEYGLTEESVKAIEFSAVSSKEELETKLFEALGREVKKTEKAKEFSRVPAFPAKNKNEKTASYASLFE